MATLWASPTDRARLRKAQSAVLLVGGYDGSGNYGDVLQVATAIETVRRLPGAPLPVVVVERETHAHHRLLAQRYAGQFDSAVFAHFQDTDGPSVADDGLVELADRAAPVRAVVYLYGGGYLNVTGSPVDAAAATQALVDGAARSALIDHLRSEAREVTDRYGRGRSKLAIALADGLRGPRLRSKISHMMRFGHGKAARNRSC